MALTTDQGKLNGSCTPSANLLIGMRDEIVDEWQKKVREQISSASELSCPIIVDTVPAFLDNLAEALAEEHPREYATESSSMAMEHGGERARLSRYSPEQLIREYQLLRDTVISKLSPRVDLTFQDRSVIQRSIDEAVTQAMMSFFLVHSRLKEQFVATLTHDLRNPLGAAKMSAELLLLELSRESGQHNFPAMKTLAQKVINNARRCDGLIQNLLDISMIRTGDRLALHLTECEILSIIKNVLADLNRKEAERIVLKGSPTWGMWDCDALQRAIENLVSNALKYGAPDTRISIDVCAVGERLILSVHNIGNPIPLNERGLLFEAFQRSPSAKSSGTKGWGIGLAFVRAVAEGHGGSIAVDSSAKLGTTFTIDFPLDATPFLNAPTSNG